VESSWCLSWRMLILMGSSRPMISRLIAEITEEDLLLRQDKQFILPMSASLPRQTGASIMQADGHVQGLTVIREGGGRKRRRADQRFSVFENPWPSVGIPSRLVSNLPLEFSS
jgi:hypothetical protein